MERVGLQAQSRTVLGKQVRQMRARDLIPAVVYGHDVAARSIQAEERLLTKTLRQAGTTALIELFLDDDPKPQLVLARDVQRNSLNGRLVHVDFYEVRLTEKVKTTPRLEFVGEPILVKAGKAVVIHNMTEIEIACLPTELINSIRVDVSGLVTMDDEVTVADLVVPDGITILADPHDVVVSIVPTRATLEEETAAAAAAAAAAEAAPAEETEK